MTQIKAGDKVVHIKKAHRGVATVKSVLHGHAVLWYPKYQLKVQGVRVRDLEVR